RQEGADAVIVTRSDEPSLVMTSDSVWEVTTPTLEVTDTAGAGDSLTAGIAAALAAGDDLRDAVALGAAAGALNVTRHGLGTGDPHTIAKLRELVKVHDIDEPVTSITQSISLDELAAKVQEQ
ncbi:MAG: PfkB family carbohydrate kinase, partial [Rhodoglobus sp.]